MQCGKQGTRCGTDAWSQEAQRVQELATHLGLALDDAELALQDVRDLQRLHGVLRGVATAPTAKGARLEVWAHLGRVWPGASAPVSRHVQRAWNRLGVTRPT